MAAAAEQETAREAAGTDAGGGWPGTAAPWLWGLAGFLACFSLIDLEPNLVEEGLVLHVAQRPSLPSL